MRLSNRTDADRAKMATSKGVIQGYTGVAAVDSAHQTIVDAQAHGTGAEQELLVPVVTAMRDLLTPDSLLTADAGYHSEANLRALATLGVDALIADYARRQRDERFATQDRHTAAPDPRHDKTAAARKATTYQPGDLTYDAETRPCVCPAGKTLSRDGRRGVAHGYVAERFRGSRRDGVPCPLRARCLRTPETTKTRHVAFYRGKAAGTSETHTDRMKRRLATPEGRTQYGRRFATVEPVFGNLRANTRRDRFTLRGRTKVDAQWKRDCLVHNIEKLAHHGYAAQIAA